MAITTAPTSIGSRAAGKAPGAGQPAGGWKEPDEHRDSHPKRAARPQVTRGHRAARPYYAHAEARRAHRRTSPGGTPTPGEPGPARPAPPPPPPPPHPRRRPLT